MDNKQNYVWPFGNGLVLDFNHTPPQPRADGPVHTLEGSAAICDADTGTILFATDGMKIWDGSGAEIPGMAPTGHSSATNSGIIVPKPDEDGRYYVSLPNIFRRESA